MFGDAAKQKPPPAAPAVRAHHDEVGIEGLRRMLDALRDVVGKRFDFDHACRALHAVAFHLRGCIGENVFAFGHKGVAYRGGIKHRARIR